MSNSKHIQFATKYVTENEPDGEKWIKFIGTAPTIDRDGEVIDTASLRIPVKPKGYKRADELTTSDVVDLPFLIDHNWSVEKQIGSVRSLVINQDGELEGVAGLADVDEAMRVHELAKKDHLGNSISGTFDYSTGYITDGVIYDAELLEFSVVFKGSNRDARVLAVSKQVAESEIMEEKPDTEQVVDDVVATDEVADVVDVKDEVKVEVTEQVAEKEVKEMSKTDEIVAKQVVAELPAQEVAPKFKKDVNAIKEVFVKQFMAFHAGDSAELARLNEKAINLDGLDSKIITPAEGTALYQSEVVTRDIVEAYNLTGNVGRLVNKIDILGATQWKSIVETNGTGFKPVGVTEVKPEDEPVWTPVVVLPKEHALIVAWYDTIARQTPIAVYDQIVRYIAGQYSRLEDNIILTFAGVTSTGGDVFAPTGLVPLLTGGDQEVPFDDTYKSTSILSALGTAYGLIESDAELSIVTNRATWGKLATATDETGNAVFKVVGQQVTAGALGTFNVVLSNEMEDGDVVMGAFSLYDLVTRGGLETLFSQHATVGSVNLFTQDASALRACVEIAGKAVKKEAFALLKATAVAP
jgi:HK97 family phage major capsid protein